MENGPTETDTKSSVQIAKVTFNPDLPLVESLSLANVNNQSAHAIITDEAEMPTKPPPNTTDTTPSKNTGLISLCGEIRNQIYDLLLEVNPSAPLRNANTTPLLDQNYRAIMRTSKQVHQETAYRLYATRRVSLSDRYSTPLCTSLISRFLFKIGPTNRALITRLSLDFTPGVDSAVKKLERNGHGDERTCMVYCLTRSRNKAAYALAVLAQAQPLGLRELNIVLPRWIWAEDYNLNHVISESSESMERQRFREKLVKIGGLEVLELGYTMEFDRALRLAVDMKVKNLRVYWRRASDVISQQIIEQMEQIGWVFVEGTSRASGAAHFAVPLPWIELPYAAVWL